MRAVLLSGVLAVLASCSSQTNTLPPVDETCAGPCPGSNIKHVVIVIQENHTFDNYFGHYCSAAAGSNPSCNDGPACCEAAPATDASGHAPIVLDDNTQAFHDPDHTAACETYEMHGGAMDRYAVSTGKPLSTACGSAENVAVAEGVTVQAYWDMAKTGAIADRYFQPEIGQSSANDMYFARASHVFDDNAFEPKGAFGTPCSLQSPDAAEFTDLTLGDLLTQKGVPWAFYVEGYDAQATAQRAGHCAERTDACPGNVNFSPCTFEPGDVPIEYFPSTRDNPIVMRDFSTLEGDIKNGKLPAVVFVKALGYHSEHPVARTRITDGVTFVTTIAHEIATSRYRSSTLFLLTYDEGGGYWDHVTPPASVDARGYGTRVLTLASGPFAKKNYVSHVVMDHSSMVKFLEWNFLGSSGQLKTRDMAVNGIGSLIDARAAGVSVPE